MANVKKQVAEPSPSQPTVQRIFEWIRAQGLNPGDRLPNIRQFAELLSVKPTVVRDGLLQAQAMGAVRIVPRSGAFLESLNFAPIVGALSHSIGPALMQEDHNLLQMLDARRFLEVELVGRAAAERRLEELLPVHRALVAMAKIPTTKRRSDFVDADIEFHTEIAKLARNSVLLSFQQVSLQLLKPYLVRLPWSTKRRKQTDESHAAIYEALVAGDVPSARKAMHEHLTLAYDNLLNEVQSVPA